MRIFKYALPVEDFVEISMPAHARLLTVQTQMGIPFVWALVNPGAPLVKRPLRVVGTGHPIDDGQCSMYLGTFQLHGGALVFHVFDLGESQ